ncbi:membrane-bound PQQ-dependent dehydrogenase, glucose/quinate/shikimate family [Bradyrhizobium sp. sBnM-33]|uniref:membrane-bound PQQ-dependent dehydrogenase, glucose/quinate/shikimate family n=1 Tax=Bradyrhizobium sp. sBnM-33 TaxID=2831780 RepID=UPI001BCCC3CB|nr:membrane-bound PQQ-dependent dehydrogenase, glucose/quinate/shikimate family [Bradyrhizobium sp. sBnM-33]WOH53363.1 membrane-bound PQQ-dependent dehydrogenase, glucose/quinate/shikimate family [Bradyrhizobium sp. sBnM-33]
MEAEIATQSGRATRLLVVAILVVIGAALSVGGGALVLNGGSPYYILTGLAVMASGVLIGRGDWRGAALYAAMLVWTVVWALWEVGGNGWQLVPRLVAPFALGLLLLLPAVRKSSVRATASRVSRWRLVFPGSLGAAVLLGAALHAIGPDAPPAPVLRTGIQSTSPSRLAQPLASIGHSDWPAFGNDQGGTRFSPLSEINASNVAQLEKIWEADLGPLGARPNGLEVTPIMIGDTLYACDGYNRVSAFDAETGALRWRQDTTAGATESGKPCRGVAYYRVPGANGLCAERIFFANQTPNLLALDGRTGEPCPGFGNGGRIDLKEGIGHYPYGHYYVSSAPQIVRGKVVVGGGIPDGQEWGGPSGVIRAYDAVSGELAWAFDPAHPERTGAPPEGQTYTRSSPNSWAPISADEALGLVYLPMGGATPDNYGGQRRPFDEDLGSSVIALDAETGRLRWRFQTVHHDIWDYDVPSQPTLVDLPTLEGIRRALIQPTKRGEIFVLDRVTGQPILPVAEQAVPQGGTAPGERLSPTQPASIGLPALRAPTLREKDMWGVTPIDQMICRILFKRSRYEGQFTPLTLDKPVLIAPGSIGGINWGSASIDVDRGIMVANWMQLPDRVELMTRAEAIKQKLTVHDGLDAGGSRDRPMLNTPYGAVGTNFLSPLGTPCTAPPWGSISAIDLTSGKLLWSKPLGTARDTGPLGIPSMLPVTIGPPNSGGSVVTRGGLVLVAAAAERTFRALDSITGRELWHGRLPFAATATPMTYRAPLSGRQIVVIATGGRPAFSLPAGTKLVAFALPR